MSIRRSAAVVLALVSSLVWTATATADGIDISFPQCGVTIPVGADFAILGVDGGRPYATPNPCLAAQVGATGIGAAFYANTANPGPAASAFWPDGQTFPRACNTPAVPGADTVDCAYDYGWHGARTSYERAVAAQAAAGMTLPVPGLTAVPADWWLDVEADPTGMTGNTWQVDVGRNLAVLQGAVDFLESKGVARIGFYSNPSSWQSVTGNTQAFARYATWFASGGERGAAAARCVSGGLTGGGVAMVQYRPSLLAPALQLDGDLRCPLAITLPGRVSLTAGRVAQLPLGLSIAQGQPLEVQLTANGGGFLQLSASSTAFSSPSVFVNVPARTRVHPIYARSRKAGVFAVSTVTAAAPEAARVVMTVVPAAAVVVRPIVGGHRIARGGRRALRAIALDRFGNRIGKLRWVSSDPRILSVSARPAGRAVITARRRGTVVVRALSGSRRSPAFRITVG